MLFNRADVLIPNKNTDMSKWSVVACDQYTSEPEYWREVEKNTAGAPSAYNLILPEVFLDNDDVDERIRKTHLAMEQYLNTDVFRKIPNCYIYVERILNNGQLRRGIVGCVDLEEYDYSVGSESKIRATEKTVVERIPPRLKVRTDAALELPHIMLLLDDEKKSIIEPLTDMKDEFEMIYDFDLMMSSGHISGYVLSEFAADEVEKKIVALSQTDEFNRKYDVCKNSPLVFAVGDGNHSLATAKEYYNEIKRKFGEETARKSPARYALTELVNLHDDSLAFEAIHRVVFGVDNKKFTDGLKKLCSKSGTQIFELVGENGREQLAINNPTCSITVGSVQEYIDKYISENGGRVDYIHGEDVVNSLVKDGNIGIVLKPMGKDELFKTVIKDGSLPRKTFSMGNASDKRFYTEARSITVTQTSPEI